MIEYLYDCIRATAGQDAIVGAIVNGSDGEPLTAGCRLRLHNENGMIGEVEGLYNGERWLFTIPAAMSAGLKGRYWYCIFFEDMMICHKELIYFV